MKLTTTEECEQWRQRLTNEDKGNWKRDQASLKQLEKKLDEKNTYYDIYKKDEVLKKEEEKTKTDFQYTFDIL